MDAITLAEGLAEALEVMVLLTAAVVAMVHRALLYLHTFQAPKWT